MMHIYIVPGRVEGVYHGELNAEKAAYSIRCVGPRFPVV